MGKLTGKVAIITGAASGIGADTVRLFVEEGARVLLVDIQDEKGHQLAGELGGSAEYLHTDVSQDTDIKTMITHAIDSFGRLDCLFNNAGIVGDGGSIRTIPAESFDQTIGVLLRGVFLGMKYAARVMKQKGTGSIISTSSIAGLRTGYGPHIYSAAKAAVIHLTRSVAMELGEHGIRVNCICPGFIATPIIGRSFGLSSEAADKTVDRLHPVLITEQPLPHVGLPKDIAQAALWLASDESSFVTGHALVVDGGLIGGRTWADRLKDNEQLRSAFDMGT